MKNLIYKIFGAVVACGLIYPLMLTGTLCPYLAAIISVVTFLIYLQQVIVTKQASISFQVAIIFGVFFSIAFTLLTSINDIFTIRNTPIFLISFAITFALLTALVFLIKKKMLRIILFSSLNVCSIIVFIFTLEYARALENIFAYPGVIVLLGCCIGVTMGSVGTLLFQFYLNIIYETFKRVADYIYVLARPFVIFFTGYVLIAFLFAGIYGYFYLRNNNFLVFTRGQPSFLNFLVYSFDTMVNGDNTGIQSALPGAQVLNSVHRFFSIIWMTIMLAATISYSAEHFEDIKLKHKKDPEPNGPDQV